MEAGDETLKTHLETGKKNALYTSPQIQNEIMKFCGDLVKDHIILDAKKAPFYSTFADKSSDISGKEQLSIGLRFVDKEKMTIREEFCGFVQLNRIDAATVANAIENFLQTEGLDPDKCVGQGYDGASAMAGCHNGVHVRLRQRYHASHKLNLVVNDLSELPQIRNCVSTVKAIITFFRESPLRRQHAPNLPLCCARHVGLTNIKAFRSFMPILRKSLRRWRFYQRKAMAILKLDQRLISCTVRQQSRRFLFHSPSLRNTQLSWSPWPTRCSP